jgi:hypothetical protein
VPNGVIRHKRKNSRVVLGHFKKTVASVFIKTIVCSCLPGCYSAQAGNKSRPICICMLIVVLQLCLLGVKLHI